MIHFCFLYKEGDKLERYTTRKTKRQRKKIIVSVLSVILVLLIATVSYAGYIAAKVKHTADEAHHSLERGNKSTLRKNKVDPSVSNFSVLFMGVDERKGKHVPTRTDALILATFNLKEKSIKLVSIPRDSKVKVVDPTGKHHYGMRKITEAHAFGDVNGMGDDYTIATVENLFNVPVDYYVRVDFESFMKIVNALGGVTVDVPVKLVTQNSNGVHGAIVLNPGVQKLDGEQALAFVRNRKSPGAGNDFGRGRRQMALIKAIIKKTASFSSITKYGTLLDSLNGHIATNFTFDQMIALHKYSGAINNIEKYQLKGKNDMSTGVYYYDPDPNSVKDISQMLKQQLGIDSNNTSSDTNQ